MRGLWESTAAINALNSLLSPSDVGESSFVLITDHKAKKNPSKSETEQGYDMGLRGMSTHGFQLTFAVMMGAERHLVTVQYSVLCADVGAASPGSNVGSSAGHEPNREGLPVVA